MATRLSLGRVALMVAVILAVLQSPSFADDLDLGGLKESFATDPATAFVEAWRIFQVPRAAGNLDGMMTIIRVVAHQSIGKYYHTVAEDMIDAAIPLAEGSGRWGALGELFTTRARSGCGRGSC